MKTKLHQTRGLPQPTTYGQACFIGALLRLEEAVRVFRPEIVERRAAEPGESRQPACDPSTLNAKE